MSLERVHVMSYTKEYLNNLSNEELRLLFEKRSITERKKGVRDSFEHCVTKKLLNECWPWKGPKSKKGYGYCKGPGERLAHRRVYIECRGPIPEGYVIMHLCNNPNCCNPSHLIVGTHKMNMEHKVMSGRQKGGRPKKQSK